MKRWLSLACCAVFALGAETAFAQQGAPSPMQKAGAKDHFQRGLALGDEAEHARDPALYEKALIEFQMSYALNPTDKALWNLAICELETKRVLDALKHFHEYDAHLQVLATPSHPHHALLKKYLAEANPLVGHFAVEATPGARVVLDGKDLGSAPLADVVDVLPGNHHFASEGRELDVVASAGVTTPVRLISDAPSVPLTSAASASGAATVDPPVTHDVTIQPSEPFWTTRRTIGVGVAGLGVIAVGVGVAFHIASNDNGSRADELSARLGPSQCAQPANVSCQALKGYGDAQSRDHALGWVFTGLGAAAVATGAVLFFIKPATTKLSLLPILSPNVGGLSVQGAL